MFEFVPLGFIGELITLAIQLAPVAAVAVGAWGIVEQSRQSKRASSTAKKVAGIQAAAQTAYAGEHYELTKRQMEMQSEQRQIDTLANLIETRSENGGPVVLTTGPIREYSAIDKINMAIGELFGA